MKQAFQITVTGIRVHAEIGARSEEQLLGQSLSVDLKMHLQKELEEDDVGATLDYGKAIHSVREFAASCGRVKLVETFAKRLLDEFFALYPDIERMRVSVQKSYIPVVDFTGSVKIEMERTREG